MPTASHINQLYHITDLATYFAVTRAFKSHNYTVCFLLLAFQPKGVSITSCVVCKKSRVKSWEIMRLSLNKPDIHLSFVSTG